MANREENLKKINAELEKLSDEELEQVAGGTWEEYEELQKILPYENNRPMRKNEVQDWLKKNLNIDAVVDGSPWHGPKDVPNIYKRNGENLTHNQVVSEINKFFNTKPQKHSWD